MIAQVQALLTAEEREKAVRTERRAVAEGDRQIRERMRPRSEVSIELVERDGVTYLRTSGFVDDDPPLPF